MFKIGRYLLKRKYFHKIFIYSCLGIFFVLLLFSGITYRFVEKTTVDREYINTSKLLQQLELNLNSVDQMITNSLFSLFFDHDVTQLVHYQVRDEDIYKNINVLNKTIIKTNTYINSILIYNSLMDKNFTTIESFKQFTDNLDYVIEKKGEIPKLVPILREIEFNNDYRENIQVLSYYLYEFKDDAHNIGSKIIINADLDAVLDSIELFNETDENRQANAFIFDSYNNIITRNTDNELKEKLAAVFSDYVDQDGISRLEGIFRKNINETDYLITYTYVESMEWTVLKVQPYKKIMEGVTATRNMFIIAIFLFGLITLIISIPLSYQIYNPINRIMNVMGLSGNYNKKNSKIDEIGYISKTYKEAVDELHTLKDEIINDEEIVKNYYLRNVLLNNSKPHKEELIKMLSNNRISVELNTEFFVCLIKLDQYRRLLKDYSYSELETIKLAIHKIIKEIISKQFKNELVDINNRQSALIINTKKYDDSINTLNILFEEIQLRIRDKFNISISMGVSGPADNIDALSGKYKQSIEVQKYNLIYNSTCIITYKMVQANMKNETRNYSANLTQRLLNNLKSGDYKEVKEDFNNIMNEISLLSYDNIIISIVNLVYLIRSVIDELNNALVHPVVLESDGLMNNVLLVESLDNYKHAVDNVLIAMTNRKRESINDNAVLIADKIKSIIDTEYSDVNLCIDSISERIGISSRKISKLFKKVMLQSIVDYINMNRMVVAAKLLEDTKYTINEIAMKVGIENSGYFYKLFKKTYGLTPKEYANKNIYKNIKS